MGKLHTTLCDMRNFKGVVIGVGYCQFQHVLQYHNPLAYNAGTNGAVRVYNFAGHKYYVLCDNTVITEQEWFNNATD